MTSINETFNSFVSTAQSLWGQIGSQTQKTSTELQKIPGVVIEDASKQFGAIAEGVERLPSPSKLGKLVPQAFKAVDVLFTGNKLWQAAQKDLTEHGHLTHEFDKKIISTSIAAVGGGLAVAGAAAAAGVALPAAGVAAIAVGTGLVVSYFSDDAAQWMTNKLDAGAQYFGNSLRNWLN